MSEFENATPRPWTKDKREHLYGSNGHRVTVYRLGAARASHPPTDQERDNAELILAAVNAREATIEALDLAKHHLQIYAQSLKDADRESAAEVDADLITIEAALKLARGESWI